MQIKKITPDDKPRVLDISRDIWGGEDYIHEVFDQWVSNPYGLFEGLFYEDRLIAYARMTYITPTDVWLEGLRKDTKSNFKGIGKIFLDHFLKILSNKKDITSVRFSTYFDNKASIKSSEKEGFQRILTCSLKNYELKDKGKHHKSNIITEDITFKDFVAYIERSDYLRLSNNLLTRGWIFYTPTISFYSKFYLQHNYFAYVEDRKISGLLLFSNVHYSDSFWISFLEAENEEIMDALFSAAVMQALRNHKSVIQILIPDEPILKGWMNKNKFTSWDQENDVILSELPLSKLYKYQK